MPTEITKYLAYVMAAAIAGRPCNWLIRKIIKRWNPDTVSVEDRMGAFIGTLERILTIIMVGVESYAAVGFIVTMKSIARYEKIKEKAFAEYFLAGTMLSILLALILALIVRRSVGKL